MKIKEITWSRAFDFNAIMECEHCGHEGELKNGYNDANYHDNVIPSMVCAECGLNRQGDTKPVTGRTWVQTV